MPWSFSLGIHQLKKKLYLVDKAIVLVCTPNFWSGVHGLNRSIFTAIKDASNNLSF
jgi:hypothetical protein